MGIVQLIYMQILSLYLQSALRLGLLFFETLLQTFDAVLACLFCYSYWILILVMECNDFTLNQTIVLLQWNQTFFFSFFFQCSSVNLLLSFLYVRGMHCLGSGASCNQLMFNVQQPNFLGSAKYFNSICLSYAQ